MTSLAAIAKLERTVDIFFFLKITRHKNWCNGPKTDLLAISWNAVVILKKKTNVFWLTNSSRLSMIGGFHYKILSWPSKAYFFHTLVNKSLWNRSDIYIILYTELLRTADTLSKRANSNIQYYRLNTVHCLPTISRTHKTRHEYIRQENILFYLVLTPHNSRCPSGWICPLPCNTGVWL